MCLSAICVTLFFAGASPAASPPTGNPAPTLPQWTNAPWTDPNFFPIAVWLQAPANARRYRAAGINTYIGLWQGPTEAQLTALRQAGMYIICEQNEVARRHLSDTNILAWMHGDEPDNAQPRSDGPGWGPPIPPAQIEADYQRLRATDPTRPVMLNLGQGVAWDGWPGRGVRSNHPEDYPEYLKGCDVVSFDIYPAVHNNPAVAGNLWFVARGVQRLIQWSEGRQSVWNCIECTHIGNPDRKATPQEVRAEVWMSLIHGSRGLIYFVHQFQPTFVEAALLADPEMLSAITAINRQIHELALVLNHPTVTNVVKVTSSNPDVPIATQVKQPEGATYLFAVGMRSGQTEATFQLNEISGATTVEVIGENRNLPVKNGRFTDHFNPWNVHLYRLSRRPQ